MLLSVRRTSDTVTALMKGLFSVFGPMNGSHRKDIGRFDSVFREFMPPEIPNQNRRSCDGRVNFFATGI
jgi:hypothetical protein